MTLPATLWFFDKGKRDDNVLFIDARNIFTQIDRAHREFSDEQIQNIAIIPRLHRGRRREFVELIDSYFERGMAALVTTAATSKALVRTGSDSDRVFGQAVDEFLAYWKGLGSMALEGTPEAASRRDRPDG